MDTYLAIGKRSNSMAMDDEELKKAARRATVIIRGSSADRIVGPATNIILHRLSGMTLPKVECPIIDLTTIPDDDAHDEKVLNLLSKKVDHVREVDVEDLIRSFERLGAKVQR